ERTGHRSRPARRPQQPQQEPDRRRLAGAVGSEEPNHLASRDGEGDVIDRHAPAELARQPVGDDHAAADMASSNSSRLSTNRSRPPWTSPATPPLTRTMTRMSRMPVPMGTIHPLEKCTSCGSRKTKNAPKIDPEREPSPPIITKATSVSDGGGVNCGGWATAKHVS